MAIHKVPNYEVSSSELAGWLEQQGADRWWSVDGDYVLGSLVSFPCPGDELAGVLRRLNRPLLLADKDQNPDARGQKIRAEDLDRLVDRLPSAGRVGEKADRALYFSWKGSDNDWLLVEDDATSESNARDVRSEQGAR
jgi:hypothetical protein